MKPPPFDFVAAASLDEALAALAEYGDEAKLLAGGQSLIPLLALRLAQPAVLVDLGGVGGLDGIHREDGHVVIGATTTERAAERSELIRASVPLLAAALPFIGHAAIRNRGTIGGSAAHADPAAEIPAVLVALDADLVATSSSRGTRTIPAHEFFQGTFTTALEPDEALVAVRVPAADPGHGVAFEETARRHGDYAMVGAAISVRAADGRIAEARIALLGVSDVALRRSDAENLLVGAEPTPALFAEAAALAAHGLTPPRDLHGTSAYRRHLAGVLVRRGLENATRNAEAAA